MKNNTWMIHRLDPLYHYSSCPSQGRRYPVPSQGVYKLTTTDDTSPLHLPVRPVLGLQLLIRIRLPYRTRLFRRFSQTTKISCN